MPPLCASTVPPCSDHELLDQTEPDTKARRRAFERRIDLHEEIEDAWKLRSVDADAVVPHANDGITAVALDGERDASAAIA